jgi:acetyl-CoA carboxylase carboxyl transferase subunit alpha
VSPRRYVMDFERPLVELEEKLASLREMDLHEYPELLAEIDRLAAEVAELHESTYTNLSAWDRVQISRNPERPKTDDYLDALFDDVVEVHGDRAFRDDEALFAGFATLMGRRVAVLGHRKGRTTKENVRRNFGSPNPEGFRKAIRLMCLADKFSLPIVSFLDTSGAYPGVEAEERGQGWAIAEALSTLAEVRAPVVVVGIGEGGSGGALAIGFGDRIIMLENSYYSVISPEGCASILYKDSARAPDAAACLRMGAQDLLELGIVDEVIPEPLGGAHHDPSCVYEAVGVAVCRALDSLTGLGPDELVRHRYERLRAIGDVDVCEANG